MRINYLSEARDCFFLMCSTFRRDVRIIYEKALQDI